MRSLLLVCALSACLVPERAAAQDEALTGAPIVLVVDGAGGRLSVTRLRRALEGVLGRPVVRPADDRASTATATLTIALVSARRWLVRFDEAGAHPTRTREVRGPALEMLVGLAVDAIAEARSASSAPTATSSDIASGSSTALADDAWDTRSPSEILDPFAGFPVSRIAIAVMGELIDPFARVGGGVRVITSPEVLDPWR